MKRHLAAGQVARARTLRREQTVFEAKLWAALREHVPGERWRRQVPIGPYFADFANHGAKLVIELDGEGHAYRRDYDRKRDEFIQSEGYLVLRFTNEQVARQLDDVLNTIFFSLDGRRYGDLRT